MLAEFFTKLEGLAKRANGVEVLQIPGIVRKVLVRQGEAYSFEPVPAPMRQVSLRGLDDIVELCRDKVIAPDPEVYHTQERITVLLDRNDRRDFAMMKLETSERFQKLVALRAGQSFGVKDAIRFLRVDLHSTGPSVDALIAGLRKIDFSRQSGTQRTVEHGRETLGRNVEAAVQQADKVPEDFRVTTPIFTNPGIKGITATIRCAVYIDLDEEQLELSTLADELQSALDGAQKDIHDKLVDVLEGVPVFNGSP